MIESPIIDEILKEGMEKGIEEGKIESKKEIARRMIAKQKTLEEICEFLDCSIKDLKEWNLIE